ncbi:MAG TPA: PAS domain S-box protein, partial [Deltaproteobacteria bacterium]|nr:PAS domain S-box protein [Deltaproteobacteria bacterium]
MKIKEKHWMPDLLTYEELLQRVIDLEAALAKNNERFKLIQHNLLEFIYEHDLEGTFTSISLEYVSQLGYSREDLVSNNIKAFIDRKYQRYFDDYMDRVLTSGRDEGLMNVVSKDGETHIIEYMNTLIKEDGTAVGVLGVARDITDQLKTEQELIQTDMRFRTILHSIEDGYYEVDLNGNMTFFNSRVNEHLGYTKEEMLGLNYRDYMDEKNAGIVLGIFHDVFLTGKSVTSLEWELMKKDGTKIFVDASVNLMTNTKGEPSGFLGIIRDTTERKRTEQELAFLAYHDALTGLFNRKAFLERLDETIRLARRYENRRAILYMDLDKFKKVNDLHGHEIGDKLLLEVSRRLKKILRDTDYISRLGGDEFTIILGNSTGLHPEKV